MNISILIDKTIVINFLIVLVLKIIKERYRLDDNNVIKCILSTCKRIAYDICIQCACVKDHIHVPNDGPDLKHSLMHAFSCNLRFPSDYLCGVSRLFCFITAC